MELLILAAAGFAYVVWRIQRVTPIERPPHTTCDACPEPAAVRLSVGHEWVDLCEGHGIPLLTQELTR